MTVSEGIERYVARKRSRGLKYECEASVFRAFLKAVGDIKLGELSTQDITTFLNGQSSGNRAWRKNYRLLMYFFEFWSHRSVIPSLEMPTARPVTRSTSTPYVYTQEQIRSLLANASTMRRRGNCKISPPSFRVLILILYATGATVGEVLALKTDNFDAATGDLTIHGSRSGRIRTIPICADLQTEIKDYSAWKSGISTCSDRLIVKNDGHPLVATSLIICFRRLSQATLGNCRTGNKWQPCLRDLRTTFAVHRITAWFQAGIELNRMLPALAVYMGHTGLSSSQKYMVLTPERFRKQLNRLSPLVSKSAWRDDCTLMTFLASL